MIKKILLSCSIIILTLFVFNQRAYSSDDANMATMLVGERLTGEPAQADYSARTALRDETESTTYEQGYVPERSDRLLVSYTGENADISAQSQAAPVAKPMEPYYPRLFYKEFFYRDNETQPIRDFRYYKIKTQPNYESVKKNIPLRDFRFDYWKNKEYK